MPDWDSERDAYTDQVGCLDGFFNANCKPPTGANGWTAAECERLEKTLCLYRAAAGFSLCRGTSGNGEKRQPCPGCYAKCKEATKDCAGTFDNCRVFDETYCDGTGAPPQPPTTVATPNASIVEPEPGVSSNVGQRLIGKPKVSEW